MSVPRKWENRFSKKELRKGRKAKPAKVFSQSRVKTSGDTSPLTVPVVVGLSRGRMSAQPSRQPRNTPGHGSPKAACRSSAGRECPPALTVNRRCVTTCWASTRSDHRPAAAVTGNAEHRVTPCFSGTTLGVSGCPTGQSFIPVGRVGSLRDCQPFRHGKDELCIRNALP